MSKDTRSGRGGKNNKTARVLSLLTTDPESAEEEKAAGREHAAEKDTKNNRGASEAAAQARIHNALENELLGLSPEPAAAPARAFTPPSFDAAAPAEPEPVPAPAPAPEASAPAMPEPEPVPAPVPAPEASAPAMPEPVPVPAPVPAPEASAPAMREPEPAPVPAPVPETAAPVTPEPKAAAEEKEDNYTCLNVTQALVEEKADKYIKMFGMCTCKRCRIDVIAMAMSNLPAKYVVVKNEDINPRLSFYEAKYNAAVITAVMSACKRVLERPHHER